MYVALGMYRPCPWWLTVVALLVTEGVQRFGWWLCCGCRWHLCMKWHKSHHFLFAHPVTNWLISTTSAHPPLIMSSWPTDAVRVCTHHPSNRDEGLRLLLLFYCVRSVPLLFADHITTEIQRLDGRRMHIADGYLTNLVPFCVLSLVKSGADVCP